MKYPNLEVFAKPDAIRKSFADIGYAVSIHHWTETAKELARAQSASIDNHAAIYKDILKDEGALSPEQILMFVEGPLGLLFNEDDQKSLVMTQATGASTTR